METAYRIFTLVMHERKPIESGNGITCCSHRIVIENEEKERWIKMSDKINT